MKMKYYLFIVCCVGLLLGCEQPSPTNAENFNLDWGFHLAKSSETDLQLNPSAHRWDNVKLPHDWSIESAFTKINTGSSTGFLPGGIGWYKKDFKLDEADKENVINVEFDGVYNNAEVWINGMFLGERPYGYISFGYDLTPHLNYGEEVNTLIVKVDHSNYLDSRWYTGSGIYRDVRLVKKKKLHIPKWGVAVSTPEVNEKSATVDIEVALVNYDKLTSNVSIKGHISTTTGEAVSSFEKDLTFKETGKTNLKFTINDPELWDIATPNLYIAKVELVENNTVMDEVATPFGIRKFHFDANKGFFLNGKQQKIKGVNLHHAAGAVGAAVPIDVWKRRLKKLKSIGCNAVRTAHNPVDSKFLDLCDQMGLLVIDEFFDEWNIPKKKSLHKLGDNLAPDKVSHGYTERFDEWAERDLKDCIRRDKNHPSIIMWSIGNEIEWTHPYYAQTYEAVNGKQEYYKYHPSFDSLKIKNAFDNITNGQDSLIVLAKKLVGWVKEMDQSRPVTCGNVHPSIGLATGYGQTVDVLGFNYRATEYDGAHKAYPNLLIYGSENWGSWEEWKACLDREFVAGIFCWTGFAYAGESGPWPHKGLNISFFDFAGFKTPRGHFYQTLWKDEPHVYMGTTPAAVSEFKYDENTGFSVEYKTEWIRRWAWYDIYDKWQYETGEEIVVQAYSNCEENELFLNGTSLGKRQLKDFAEDNIVKWMVPFEAGELKVIGYNNHQKVAEYILNTTDKPAQVALTADKTRIKANHQDVVHIEARLKDKNGNLITHQPTNISFEVDGNIRLLGIDNGATDNVQGYKSFNCQSHNGKVLLMLQSTAVANDIKIKAKANDIVSEILVTVE